MTPSIDLTARLRGRTALITGASRGIGAAVARRYAAEGAAVAIAHEPTDERTTEAVALADELTANGARTSVIAGDLQDPETPARLVAAANDALGPVDIVVANAAASGRRHFTELSLDEWETVQAVNVRATWLLVKAAYPQLIRNRNGAVITLSSIMAVTGQPHALHYTTSKAALIGLTRELARELGPDGVRINAVMPGAIRTEHEEGVSPDAAEAASRVLPRQALQRRGVADDLAGAFAFLASDDASFVTGQVICVDGGWIFY